MAPRVARARSDLTAACRMDLKWVTLGLLASFPVHQLRHWGWRDPSSTPATTHTCCATPRKSLNFSEPKQ